MIPAKFCTQYMVYIQCILSRHFSLRYRNIQFVKCCSINPSCTTISYTNQIISISLINLIAILNNLRFCHFRWGTGLNRLCRSRCLNCCCGLLILSRSCCGFLSRCAFAWFYILASCFCCRIRNCSCCFFCGFC